MWNDIERSCSKVNIKKLVVLDNANADLWDRCGGKAGEFHINLPYRMVHMLYLPQVTI
jgi:hypothetical protein